MVSWISFVLAELAKAAGIVEQFSLRTVLGSVNGDRAYAPNFADGQRGSDLVELRLEGSRRGSEPRSRASNARGRGSRYRPGRATAACSSVLMTVLRSTTIYLQLQALCRVGCCVCKHL